LSIICRPNSAFFCAACALACWFCLAAGGGLVLRVPAGSGPSAPASYHRIGRGRVCFFICSASLLSS
jgi:hypothetical protein